MRDFILVIFVLGFVIVGLSMCGIYTAKRAWINTVEERNYANPETPTEQREDY